MKLITLTHSIFFFLKLSILINLKNKNYSNLIKKKSLALGVDVAADLIRKSWRWWIEGAVVNWTKPYPTQPTPPNFLPFLLTFLPYFPIKATHFPLSFHFPFFLSFHFLFCSSSLTMSQVHLHLLYFNFIFLFSFPQFLLL